MLSKLYIISIRRIIKDWHWISSGKCCDDLGSIYYCSIFNYTSDNTSYFCLPSLMKVEIKHQQFVVINPKCIWMRIHRESFTSSWSNLTTNKMGITGYYPIIFFRCLHFLKEKFNKLIKSSTLTIFLLFLCESNIKMSFKRGFQIAMYI